MPGADSEKNRKIKDLSKNTIVFTIGSFGAKIISFLLVPLYTYVLSTSEYGTLDIVTTTVQLLIPVLTLNVQDAVLRFALDNEYKKEDVIRVSLRINVISACFLGVILMAGNFIHALPITPNYLFFLYVSYVAGAINNSLTMYLKAKNKVVNLTIWGLINTLITCVFNLVLLLVLKLGVNGYMISYASGTIIADIGMIATAGVLTDIKESRPNPALRKAMLAYGIPLVLNSIAWWINNASDRYILTYFCGTSVNGIYSVSYKIPSILAILQTIFYNAWSVSAITEYDKNDTDGFMGNVYTAYGSMSIIGCSAIMLFNIAIARVLYSKDFFQAWEFVPFLLVGTAFNGLGHSHGSIFSARKLTKEISLTTLVGAAINTILNFILIPQLGALGAAIATMIGYFAVWVIRTIRLRNIIKMKVKWDKHIICIIVLIVQCLTAIFIRNPLYQIPSVVILCLLSWSVILKTGNKMISIIKKK